MSIGLPWLRWSALAAALVSLCGCPPMDDGNDNTNTNENANDNSGGGDTLSAAARTAVLSEIEQLLPDLDPADVAATQQAVVARLEALPDVASAGVNPNGSVWAIFSDGRPLVVLLNSPMPLAALEAARGAPKPVQGPLVVPPKPDRAAKSGARGQDAGGPYSVPLSNKAYVFNTFGPDPETETHVNAIALWLSRAGYEDAAPSREGTIENFLEVREAGLLYVQGHGGIGYLPGDEQNPLNQEIFAMGTTSARTPDGASDARYKQMLDDAELGYLYIPNVAGVPLTFGPIGASRYFLTRNFVRNHWSFAAGSWVYLDVCDGYDLVFKDECLAQGAGLFLSWDRTVRHSDSLESSQFLFSRVLGVESLEGVSRVTLPQPRQRAWNLATVYDYMNNHDRTTPPQIAGFVDSMLTSYSLHNDIGQNNGRASLRQETANDTLDPLLIPGLSSMSVDDVEGRLFVNGSFGHEPGTLTVGGTEVNVLQWDRVAITAELPPGASGPVVAAVGRHKSVPRMLTKWTGTATVTFSGEDLPRSTASVYAEFRGDVQSARPFLESEPQYVSQPSFSNIPARGFLVDADESGTDDCGPTWEGTVTTSLPNPPGADAIYQPQFANDDPHYFFQLSLADGATLDANTGQIKFGIAFGAFQPDGVLREVRCEFTPDRDDRSDFSITGVFTDTWNPPSDYNTHFDLPVTDGGNVNHTVADFTATHLPSASDPR